MESLCPGPSLSRKAGCCLLGVLLHILLWHPSHPNISSNSSAELQDLALKLGHVDEEEIQEALGPIRGFDGAIHNESALPPGVVEEATWWNDYWRHHHVDRMAHPELYDLRAPGQLVAVYLVYFVPLFIVGVCGWVTMHWPVNNTAGVFWIPRCSITCCLTTVIALHVRCRLFDCCSSLRCSSCVK